MSGKITNYKLLCKYAMIFALICTVEVIFAFYYWKFMTILIIVTLFIFIYIYLEKNKFLKIEINYIKQTKELVIFCDTNINKKYVFVVTLLRITLDKTKIYLSDGKQEYEIPYDKQSEYKTIIDYLKKNIPERDIVFY